MGYRSDVVLVIKSNIDLPNEPYEGDTEGLMDHADFKVREDWTCYGWESIKWNEAFPEIKALMDCLRGLEAKDYYLTILGDEFGDFEELGSATSHGDCPFLVYPQQSLIIA